MALNNIQSRVERSIYNAIRLLLVSEGYLPDINNNGLFPKFGTDLTSVGEAAWQAALTTIKNAQGFASEVFNNSSSQFKGLKKVPRIGIIPRRIMPGDVGLPLGHTLVQNPLDPDNLSKYINPPEAADLHIDIHLVSNTTSQDRFLNAIMAKVIGSRRYLPMYDNPNERFLITQFNFYDLPDAPEGINENVYSYEVKDLYMFDESPAGSQSLIKEITLETTVAEYQTILAQNGAIIGPYQNSGSLFIDLSGINYIDNG